MPSATDALPTAAVIFDRGDHRLTPLADLVPLFQLQIGRHSLANAIGRGVRDFCPTLSCVCWSLLPSFASAVAEAAEGGAASPDLPPVFAESADTDPAASVALFDSRWVDLSSARFAAALESRGPVVIRTTEGVPVAATLPATHAAGFLRDGAVPQDADTVTLAETDGRRLTWPWDLLEVQVAVLEAEAELDRRTHPGGSEAEQAAMRRRLGEQGVHVIGEHALFCDAADTVIDPGVVLDLRAGAIVLSGARVGAQSVIEGPVALGEGVVVSPRTHLRGPVTIGPHCKVGGEIKGVIMQRCSNKAHDGYLGDALVGRWCNLGAGTVASNLKNTYGDVRVTVPPASGDGDPETVDTGRRFQGPILGDYVRTAIGTRLLTGSLIGTGTCLVTEGYAPKYAGPMEFHAPGGVSAMDPEAFLRTARRMRARRGAGLPDAVAARLRALMPS